MDSKKIKHFVTNYNFIVEDYAHKLMDAASCCAKTTERLDSIVNLTNKWIADTVHNKDALIHYSEMCNICIPDSCSYKNKRRGRSNITYTVGWHLDHIIKANMYYELNKMLQDIFIMDISVIILCYVEITLIGHA